ncbi:MAG: 50S ribosomal protein L23 [Patescibacteria group bacterium]|nr:50S ribosomal protein L23 [Patescibacteria group bacterium]
MDSRFLILKPVVTEKSLSLQEKGDYCFWVDAKAGKSQIAKAIEELFKVKPVSIRTILVKGKTKVVKRQNRKVITGLRKKAIVKFPEGSKIPLLSGGKGK